MPSLELSDHAIAFRNLASSDDQFLGTCDGGDLGSRLSPSVWLMGVEPGWPLSVQTQDEGAQLISDADTVYSVERQLSWPFNRTAFKLLSALAGGSVKEYEHFARKVKPFERGALGYFKANLFPVPFHNLGAWDDAAKLQTGFGTKAGYQSWVREARFPILSSRIRTHRPRLLICTGLQHLQDFFAIAEVGKSREHIFEVNGHQKRMYLAYDGIVPLVVLPHLSGGPNGLNSNVAIEHAAQVILDTWASKWGNALGSLDIRR